MSRLLLLSLSSFLSPLCLAQSTTSQLTGPTQGAPQAKLDASDTQFGDFKDSNTTLTFYPSTTECNIADLKSSSPASITFTTADWAAVVDRECFNLATLFSEGRAKNEGYNRNTTEFPLIDGFDNTYGVTFRTSGSSTYDSDIVYSKVLYQYYDYNSSDGKVQQKMFPGLNEVNFFAGENCTSSNEPMYSWSCQSGEDAICRDVGYGIRSFSLLPAIDGPGKMNKGIGEWCFIWARDGVETENVTDGTDGPGGTYVNGSQNSAGTLKWSGTGMAVLAAGVRVAGLL